MSDSDERASPKQQSPPLDPLKIIQDPVIAQELRELELDMPDVAVGYSRKINAVIPGKRKDKNSQDE